MAWCVHPESNRSPILIIDPTTFLLFTHIIHAKAEDLEGMDGCSQLIAADGEW